MNKQKKIAQNGKLVDVDRITSLGIERDMNAIRYRARLRKECAANLRRSAYCEGDCACCRFRLHRTASVDERNGRLDGQVADIYATGSEMDYKCVELLADMAHVDPDGELIGRMILMTYDAKDIAQVLGISLSAYYARLKRIAQKIGKEG